MGFSQNVSSNWLCVEVGCQGDRCGKSTLSTMRPSKTVGNCCRILHSIVIETSLSSHEPCSSLKHHLDRTLAPHKGKNQFLNKFQAIGIKILVHRWSACDWIWCYDFFKSKSISFTGNNGIPMLHSTYANMGLVSRSTTP